MNSKLILLVDDDDDDRLIFAEALKEIKPLRQLDMVRNCMELNTYLLKDRRPDIIFLDLNMPGVSGRDWLRELKQNKGLKNTCVVIYTFSASEEDVEHTREMGASLYLRKHANFYRLKRTLSKLLKTNLPFDKFIILD